MSKKTQKILNGDYTIFPSNQERFPRSFLEDEDEFVERWAHNVKKSYEAAGEEITRPVGGIVLKVQEGADLTLGGPRHNSTFISPTVSSTSLRMWVHTTFDAGLAVPKNFITPGKEEDLIYQHFIFEPQTDEIGKIVPKVGDIVQVIHPWAWGFTNKVGLYVGKFADGTPPTFEPASKKFNNKNKRIKEVPVIESVTQENPDRGGTFVSRERTAVVTTGDPYIHPPGEG
tara:strand:+ start:1817 stop:2503 length:687 start_codon:yes stop_codon:yes gene_type:complete